DAVRDLVIGQARDLQAARAGPAIAFDQLDLVVDLPGDVVQPDPDARFLRQLEMAVLAVAVAALGRLDHPEVVRRVAGAEEARSQTELAEFQCQAADAVVEARRAIEVVNEQVDVTEPARAKDRSCSRHDLYLRDTSVRP